MTTRELEKRSQRSEIEPLVFSRTKEGIKVYSARDPKKAYLLSGSPEAPKWGKGSSRSSASKNCLA